MAEAGPRLTPVSRLDVRALAIDPTHPATIYVGTYSGRFPKPRTGGVERLVSSGLTNSHVYALAIDPTTPSILYAGMWGGVFKSTNSGGNWNALNTGLTNSHIYALAAAAGNPTTLHAGTYGGGVFDLQEVAAATPTPTVTPTPVPNKIYLPVLLKSYAGGW